MKGTSQHTAQFLLRATKIAMYVLVLSPLLYWSKLMFLHTSTKTYLIYIVAEVSLLLFLFLIARYPAWRPRFTLIGKLLLIYIVILIATSLIGIDPLYSFWGSLDRMSGMLTWLHLLAIFCAMSSVLHTQEEWTKFFSLSSLVALLIATFHLLSLGGAELIPEARGGSTLGNSSFLAVYLLFHVFFSLFVASQQQKGTHRYLWIGASAFLTLTLTTVSAIAIQYSLIGGFILLGALLLIDASVTWKKRLGWCVLFLLTAIFLLMVAMAFQPGNAVREKFIELSSGSRFVLWDMAWQGIKERPIVGWGLENFDVVALSYYDPCLGSQECGFEMWFDRAHNKLLDVWVESGLLGLVIYLALMAMAVVELWRAKRNTRISWMTFSLFTAALATYFVQNLTALDTITSLLFWVSILAFANVLGQEENNVTRRVPGWIPMTASALLPVTFFFFILQPVRGNLAFAQTRNATTLEERVEAYQRATTLSPLGIDMRRLFLEDQTARVFWNIPAQTLQTIESSARIELWLAQAGLEQSLGHVNQQLRVLIGLGIMYQTEGHFFDPRAFQKAEEVLKRAIELYPAIPQPKWTLAGVYLDQGQVEEALALTQSVLDSAPNSPQAYNYQLIVLKWKGDEETFETLAAQALERIPNLKADVEKLRAVDIQANKQKILGTFHH